MLDKDVHYIQVNVPWKSIYTLLIMIVYDKNPEDNISTTKRVISPLQHFWFVVVVVLSLKLFNNPVWGLSEISTKSSPLWCWIWYSTPHPSPQSSFEINAAFVLRRGMVSIIWHLGWWFGGECRSLHHPCMVIWLMHFKSFLRQYLQQLISPGTSSHFWWRRRNSVQLIIVLTYRRQSLIENRIII